MAKRKDYNDCPRYSVRRFERFRYLSMIVEGPDCEARESAIAEMRDLALKDGRCANEMCHLHYCSACFVPDDVEAARWAMIAADLGYDPVGLWLDHLLNRDRPYIGYEPDMEPVRPMFRWDSGGRGQYRNPCQDCRGMTEFQILRAITRTESSGRTYLEDRSNDGHGYENDTFAFRYEYYLEDDFWMEPRWLANFIFKPAGFELDWYKHIGKCEQVNQEVTEEDMRRMFLFCIDSARRDIGRKAE